MKWGDRIAWTDERIATLRLLVSENMTDGQISKVMGLSRGSICGARFRFNIQARNGGTERRGTPEDFHIFGPAHTVQQCADHYRAAPRTVRRWYVDLNLTPAPWVHPKKKAKAERIAKEKKENPLKALKRQRKFIKPMGAPVAWRLPEREASLYSRAQLHLQKYGPCFRAKIIDPRAANDEWMVCGRRVTQAEMLSIAARKGFSEAA
jgi:hypothetical protein